KVEFQLGVSNVPLGAAKRAPTSRLLALDPLENRGSVSAVALIISQHAVSGQTQRRRHSGKHSQRNVAVPALNTGQIWQRNTGLMSQLLHGHGSCRPRSPHPLRDTLLEVRNLDGK